jgi:PAS domain S-box-containing protein
MSFFKLSKENESSIPWSVLIMFSLMTIGILLIAYFDYKSQKNKITKDYQERITSIALLKTKQIELWRTERLGDAELIRNNNPLVKSIKTYLIGKNQVGNENDLKKWMESLNSNYDYNGVFILDTLSKIRLAVTKSDSGIFNQIKEESNLVLKDLKVRMTDLYWNVNRKQPNIDILVPLFDDDSMGGRPFGIILIRIDPGKILFPLIQSWPTPSKSSETLLVRKEGDSILYLNELRFKTNTTMRLSFPISNETLPSSLAVKGIKGLVEGIDYRNEPVVAYLADVSGTTWHMISKVDKKEFLQPLKQYLSFEILVIFLLILINAILSVFWIWNQHVNMYRFKLKNEKALLESEEKFNKAFLMSPVTVTISSAVDNKFIDINSAFLEDMEYTQEEVIGRTAKDLAIWGDENERLWVINELKEKGKIFGKTLSYRTKTGNLIYGLTSMAIIRLNGEPCNLSTVINITESFKADAKLKESEELYNKLFHNMLNGFSYCKMIYELGRPYDFLYINVNESFESLTGLKNVIGKKASEAIPGIQEADPGLLERYARVASTGIPESFEIFVESLSMWFSVSVYSPEKGFFVAVFDVITERKTVELKLAFNAHLLSSVNDALVASDDKFRITYWNTAASKIYGWKAEEVIGQNGIQILNTEWSSADPNKMRQHITETGQWIGEATQTRKDGSRFQVEISSFVIRNSEGAITGYVSVNRDITERKQYETLLKNQNEELEKFNRTMVGREIRMIELKREINELCLKLNLPERYKAPKEILKGMN